MARKWWTLIAVSVATFMLLLDITVVNTALPSIAKDLGASFNDLQWVVDAYTLALAAVVLTAGSLADRFGRRLLFAGGLVIFAAASLAGGTRPGRDRPQHLEGDSGHRRRGDVRRLAGPPRPGVPRRPGTRYGDGHLRGNDRDLGGRRPAGRRRDHDRPRLEVGVLPQRADRHRGPGDHPGSGARVARPQRVASRLARADHAQRRSVRAGLRPPAW